jgi:hypothetical protein
MSSIIDKKIIIQAIYVVKVTMLACTQVQLK